MLLEREAVAVSVPTNILIELIAMARPESRTDHAVLAEIRRCIDQAENQARALGNVRQIWNDGDCRL